MSDDKLSKEDINFLQNLTAYIRNKENLCLIENCNKKAISSHVISNSLLNKWSHNKSFFFLGSIFTSAIFFDQEKCLFFSKNKHMKKSKKMGVFNGYCEKHDREKFYPIDNKEYILSNETIQLNIQRIRDYEKWLYNHDFILNLIVELYIHFPLERNRIIEKLHCSNYHHISNNILVLFGEIYPKIDDVNCFPILSEDIHLYLFKHKQKRVMLKNKITFFNNIYYKCINIKKILPYIFYGTHLVFLDGDNVFYEKICMECIIFMNFDFQKNETNIVFCCLEDEDFDEKTFLKYFNSFKNKTVKDLFMFMLKNITLGVISNDFIENIKNNETDIKIFKHIILDHDFFSYSMPDDTYIHNVLSSIKKKDVFKYLDNFD